MKKVLKDIIDFVKKPHNVHLCGLPSKRFSGVIKRILANGLGRGYKVVELNMHTLVKLNTPWNLGVRLAKECGRQMDFDLGELAGRRCVTVDDFEDTLEEFRFLIEQELKKARGIVFLWRHFEDILKMDNKVGFDLYSTLACFIMKLDIPMIISSYVHLKHIQRRLNYSENTNLAGRFEESGMVWVKPEETVSHGIINDMFDDRSRILQGLSDAQGRSYMDVLKGIMTGEGKSPSQSVIDELRGYGVLDASGVAKWVASLFFDVQTDGPAVKITRQSAGRSKHVGEIRKAIVKMNGKERVVEQVGIRVASDLQTIQLGGDSYKVTSQRAWDFLDELCDSEKKSPGSGCVNATSAHSNLFRGTDDLKSLRKYWIEFRRTNMHGLRAKIGSAQFRSLKNQSGGQ